MTTPAVQPEASEGRVEMSIEEMDQVAAAPPDLSKVELASTQLETFKGKTAAELVAHAKQLEDMLKASEQNRARAEQLAAIASRGAPAPPPVAPPPPQETFPTDEEIAKLYEENPAQAMKVMTERAVKIAQQSLDARLQPLIQGTSASLEAAARAKYPEEFQLFATEIQDVISKLPNAKAALSTPESWDDLISWVRGRPGHFERMIEHKTSKTREVVAPQARQTQQDSLGFSPAPTGRGPVVRSDGTLDPLAAEIAEKLGMSQADYIKWSKVGG